MVDGVLVGRVAAVLRYPVKSMAADSVDDVDVSWHGLSGDRRWAFVRSNLASNGFPWLTLRQRNDLNGYHPCWTEPERRDASAGTVRTPAGARFDITAPALAAELGAGVRVMKLNRGTFDSMPLSLITTRTVESLGDRQGPPDPLVLTTWMRIDGRDKRCVVVNVDPVTGRRDPAVLGAIAAHWKTRVGVYGSTIRPGRVAVGDSVVLQP
jgi:hypothetical protein